MKRLRVLPLFFIALVVSAHAQAATRPVILTWTASPSTSVVGYNLFRCAVASGGSTCTPSATSTPLNTTPVSALTYTDSPAVQTSYGYGVVAVGPACSGTSPVNTPCSQSAITLSPIVPVPPQVQGGGTIIIVVS